MVSNDCAIDLPAGPTEAIVVAAEGNARWIAADLLAQAEHAKDAASFLITTSRSLARQVQREIKWQLGELPFCMARVSTELAGAILVADSPTRLANSLIALLPSISACPNMQTNCFAKSITASLY